MLRIDLYPYARSGLILCCIVTSLVTGFLSKWEIVGRSSGMDSNSTQQGTLVMYTFAASDPEYRANLEYFLRFGTGGHGVHYVFILQQMSDDDVLQEMPELPSNAQYLPHHNECFDWGTFGWALQSKEVDLKRYRYFIFMNSSVRGPFLPPYWPATLHWTSIYTERIGPKVKAVGSTINCQPVWWRSNPAEEQRHNPHVQSYVMATDQVGLTVMMKDGNVFGCHDNLLDTVWHSEVGASKAIFDAGYSLDSLMLKYQRVDWSDRKNWECNNRQNPYADFAYDGVMINPLEVLFVKVKSYQVESDWLTSRMAVTYDRWSKSQGTNGGSNNSTFDRAQFSYLVSKAFTMSLRGEGCFDSKYYLKNSPDVQLHCTKSNKPQAACVWGHFVSHGQFEDRSFRFKCDGEIQYPADSILKMATVIAQQSITQAAAGQRHQ